MDILLGHAERVGDSPVIARGVNLRVIYRHRTCALSHSITTTT